MAYFYSDSEERQSGGPPIDFTKIDAVKAWAKHYANMLMLGFLEANETDGRARADVRREIAVCQKKMDYWQKQPSWEAVRGLDAAEECKKLWRESR